MIRPRRSEDLERCLELLHAVHLADRYPSRWPEDPPRWLTGRAYLAAWVSENAGAIDGHLSLHATDEARAHPEWREALPVPAEQLAVVSRFCVALETRRRGVGSALMDAAESYSADRGLRLVLDVADHNEGAITLCERRRWRRVGTTSLLLGDGRTTLPLVVFALG
jgi:GNAT superfamily N-acetyltransferase